MGNYASSCSFMISPVTKTNKSARVIFPSGEIRQFQEPIKAAEIMFETPSFFLVNYRSLTINHRFSPLSADEDLERGNVYVMFPMRRVNSMVTPADMAVFWMTGKRISGKISSEEGQVMTSGGEVMVAEQRRVVVDSPEFGYRVVGCRSRKPMLDTITEEPFCLR